MHRSASLLTFVIVITAIVFSAFSFSSAGVKPPQKKKLKALIVDGQNNHGAWPKTTLIMKDYLEQTGLFTVDVDRTIYTWQGPHNDTDEGMGEAKRKQLISQYPIASKKKTISVEKPKSDSTFVPDFSKYDLVVSNFGWMAASWPRKTEEALEKFVKNGGGLMIIHAANNSFPQWAEYNKMIGLGGWGDRSEKDGPYVYFDNGNHIVRDTIPGSAGSHGKQAEFVITIRDSSHPITRSMPTQWLHTKDELYVRLRGPAQNMKILATSTAEDQKNAESPHHDPVMLAIDYGKGRVFHTLLGHTDYSMECVGFIVMFQRAAEWAATGKVTDQTVPADFPTATEVKSRKWNK